ncbi:MAG: hypothetical protein M1835_002058, partial [Candelina submexicana]
LRLDSEANSSKAWVEHNPAESQVELLQEAHLHPVQALSYYLSIVGSRPSVSVFENYNTAQTIMYSSADLQYHLMRDAFAYDSSELPERFERLRAAIYGQTQEIQVFDPYVARGIGSNPFTWSSGQEIEHFTFDNSFTQQTTILPYDSATQS